MRTIETKLYKFSELNESAQDNAIREIRDLNSAFFWSSEYIESVKECLSLLGCRLIDYSIDWSNINGCNWKIDADEIEDMQEFFQSYLPYINGEKDVTGFCADYDFFKPIQEYIEKPYDIEFSELINDCVYGCFYSGCKDYEHNMSDEGIIECIECNDFEFTEDGELN